ncbi:hypothetical protein GCM10010328_46350 [Streptomyces rubiginosohelvolus]|uniref:Uncharacterized protein n=1 Tax=Streptomyces rubiginosohelvolus TaxID=67362 RepID=A0ABQ3C958_9ACTN|nr:hypothetical protein GCM10010328_46350 [Streptomyces pluricolorescens]
MRWGPSGPVPGRSSARAKFTGANARPPAAVAARRPRRFTVVFIAVFTAVFMAVTVSDFADIRLTLALRTDDVQKDDETRRRNGTA